MDIRTHLEVEIEDLKAQISALKQQGPFLQGVRVEIAPAGGTASLKSKQGCKYARLRSGKGKLLDNGKKSKYIPVSEISTYQAMCHRGKSVTQLERKIENRQKKLKQIDAIAAHLGLS